MVSDWREVWKSMLINMDFNMWISYFQALGLFADEPIKWPWWIGEDISQELT